MSRRRVLTCVAFLLLPLAAIEVRLFHLQVLQGAEFREEAESKVTAIEVIANGRGRILDRNGVVLAQDDRTFSVDLVLNQLCVPRMTPAEVRSLVKVASDELVKQPELALQPCSMSRLARMFGIRRDLLETAIEYALVSRCMKSLARLTKLDGDGLYAKVDVAYRRIGRMVLGKSSRDARRIADAQRELPIRLINEVGYAVASEILVDAEAYPGLVVTERLRRLYPQGAVGCHVVGYVGKMSEEQYRELEQQEYFSRELIPIIGEEEYRRKERHGYFMADVMGKAGIELEYNDALKGSRGAEIIERDLFHRNRNVLKHVAPTRGRDVTLTIDIELQRKVEEILRRSPTSAGHAGVAIVCDVAAGEILAMASNPGFDPNELISPVTPEAYEAIFKHPQRPLINRAAAGEYPLGSVFKVVTASAALRTGTITATTTIECTGKYREDMKHFNCWIFNKFHGQHGPLTVSEGLEHSCNVFFYNAATRAGAQAMIETARDYGFGAPTGIDLPAEQAGDLPGLAALLAGHATGITPNELLNLGIGQGRLIVTPLQVMRAMLAVANGGTLVDFRLDRSARRPTHRLDVPDEHLAQIRRGLYLVVNAAEGTAHKKSDLWKYRAAGKTSTADVASAAAAAGHPNLKPMCWFAGYAPHDAPKYAFVVVVEHGEGGSASAAPVAAEILAALGMPKFDKAADAGGGAAEDSGD